MDIGLLKIILSSVLIRRSFRLSIIFQILSFLIMIGTLSTVSAGPSSTAEKKHTYGLYIDCNHPSISKEWTKSVVVASLLDAKRKIIKDVTLFKAALNKKSCTDKLTRNVLPVWSTETLVQAKFVELSIQGGDRLYIDALRLHGDGKTVAWGKDGGKGWCMSTQPKDGGGSWKKFAGKNCYRTLFFNIKTGKVKKGKVIKRNGSNPPQADFSDDNVYIVDAEKKFCLSIFKEGNRYNSRYLDVRPFNRASINDSLCRLWRIEKITGKEDSYRLISNQIEYLHVNSKGAYSFNKRVTSRAESLWNITASGLDHIVIKNLSNRISLGISKKGLVANAEGNRLRVAKGSPPDINETYEYSRSYRNGYSITVKETPESTVSEDQNNQGGQQAGAGENVYGDQQSGGDKNDYDDQPIGEYENNYDEQNDDGSQNIDKNGDTEEQKQRLKIADSAYDAGLQTEAFIEYETLANEGMGLAQFYTGSAYYNGEGVEKNFAQAMKWYQLAGDNNVPEAAYWLAKIYYYALNGVARNDFLAAQWAGISLDGFNGFPNQGNKLDVSYLYAKMLENGHGVPVDLKEALYLYEFVRSSDRQRFPTDYDIARVKKMLRERRLDSFKKFRSR